MLSASSSLLSISSSLRDYGDFDRCIDIVADDDERKPTEQFFTGQYCMMQIEMPLPLLNKNITYTDKLLNFNDTELSGPVSGIDCPRVAVVNLLATLQPKLIDLSVYCTVCRVFGHTRTIPVLESIEQGDMRTIKLHAFRNWRCHSLL